MSKKIFMITSFVWAFYVHSFQAQASHDNLTFDVVHKMTSALEIYDTCQYKARMLFKEFSSEIFDERNFNIYYKLNSENGIYGYDWKITEILKSGFAYTFMILPAALFIIYEGNKGIGQHELSEGIELGSYTETIRNYFILDQVYFPFINIPLEEITVLDSNNAFYLTRQMNEFATRELILNKHTFLPIKSTSTIWDRDFELTQILEIDFWFDENIKTLSDTVFSLEYYLSSGYVLKYFNKDYVSEDTNKFTISPENSSLLLNYKFISEYGDSLTINLFENKYILLDFWYSSCFPCLKSMPILNQLDKEYTDAGLKVIGINCIDLGNRTYLSSKLRNKNIEFPLLFGSRDIIQFLGITSFPTYLLITPERKVEYINGNVHELKKVIDLIFDE